MELNVSQQNAVTNENKRLLLLAGPGTGKTETLSERIAYFIREKSVSPGQILMFTYTNKAATNMTQRVRGKLGAAESIVSGTFHSLAYRMLRHDFCSKGILPDYKVLPEHHAARLRREATNIFNNENTKLAGVLKNLKGYDLLELYERKTKLNLSSNFLEGTSEDVRADAEGLTLYIKELSKVYERLKSEYQVMDFNDLLFRFKCVLEENPSVSELIQSRHPHIYVDEYQDTNEVQVAILKNLLTPESFLTVVGDDTQSIYSFQGSDVGKIRQFGRDFPESDIVVLDENYRSSAPIVEYVNALNATCVGAYPKILISRGPKSEIKPKRAVFVKESREAAWVVEEIMRLVTDEKVPLSEIAVLFRIGSVVEPIERRLQKENIPYTREGGIKFANLKHIQFFISFLELLENPYDWLAWEVLLPAIPNIGEKLTQSILQDLKTNQGNWSWEKPPVFSIGRGKRHSSLLNFWQDMIEASKINKETGVRDYLEEVLMVFKSIYGRYFYVEQENQMVVLASATQLPDKVDDHIADIKDYIKELSTSYIGLVKDFISEVVAGNDQLERKKGLTLSTIHSAKGLEWTAVFVIGNTDSVFPSMGFGLERNQLEEERRLYYVACSRAKKYLYVSAAHKYNLLNTNQKYKGKVSQFADDIRTIKHLERLREPNVDPFTSVNPHRVSDYALIVSETTTAEPELHE